MFSTLECLFKARSLQPIKTYPHENLGAHWPRLKTPALWQPGGSSLDLTLTCRESELKETVYIIDSTQRRNPLHDTLERLSLSWTLPETGSSLLLKGLFAMALDLTGENQLLFIPR